MKKSSLTGTGRAEVIVALALGLALGSGQLVHAQSTSDPVALSGTVSSAAEGNMEGVIVSARRANATFTVSVVTDASGEYAFPNDRLEPGEHTVSIRAAGYVLRPSTRAVQVTGRGPVTQDLRLEEADLLEKALHLSSAEWMMSYPLSDEEIYSNLRDCARCHNQRRVAMSRFDEKELPYVMERMTAYWLGSTPVNYQLPAPEVSRWGREGGVQFPPFSPYHLEQSRVVAAVNLSDGPWDYELKTYPRPTGDQTEVIYTTYDLPRAVAKPHDVGIGPDGWVYYSDFNDSVLGKLNPQTGETVEYRFPNPVEIFPELAEEQMMAPTGNRTLFMDREGKIYLSPPGLRRGMGYTAVFDPETEEFEFYAGTGHFISPQSKHVDGKVWFRPGGQLYQAELLGAGRWEGSVVATGLAAYDSYVDSANNAYGASRGSTEFWRVDARTYEITQYPIPDRPRGETGLGTGSRRGLFDSRDRLWFGGFDGNVIGKLDPSLPAGEAIELFPVPMPWFQPYMAQSGEDGYVWTGSISSDHVARMDEDTEEWDFYLLPYETNIRHIHVQPGSQSGELSSLWVGMNHEAGIVHIEPLEG